jgi:hypothetical protein
MGDLDEDLGPMQAGYGLPLPASAFFPNQEPSWTLIEIQQQAGINKDNKWT